MTHPGEVIRAARTERGLSQAAAAEAVGLSVEAVCRIERGKWHPSLKTAVRVCRALDIRLRDLVDLPEDLV